MSFVIASQPHVAVIGSTGAVGEELLKILEESHFPTGALSLFASQASAGKKQSFRKREYTVQLLEEDSFQRERIDLAFFSAGSSIARKFAPLALAGGAFVIDNSSAFRMEAHVPLLIPEINAEELRRSGTSPCIIANPNCSTIIMLMAIMPAHRLYSVRKIIVATYQAVSGAGARAMRELEEQTKERLAGRSLKKRVFPHPIAFNIFSHNSAIDAKTACNEEERKMIEESHKILKDTSIAIAPTCIRIPTFRAHGEAIHLELSREANLEELTEAIKRFPGLRLLDQEEVFPMPITASEQNDIQLGRVRYSYGGTNRKAIDLWCCGDQIRKGAALNAVQTAQLLLPDSN